MEDFSFMEPRGRAAARNPGRERGFPSEKCLKQERPALPRCFSLSYDSGTLGLGMDEMPKQQRCTVLGIEGIAAPELLGCRFACLTRVRSQGS